MAVWMSLRAYSRHRGDALSAVQKAIKTKRVSEEAIRRGDTGRIVAIEQELADRQWAANTDPSEALKNGKGFAAPQPKSAATSEAEELALTPPAGDSFDQETADPGEKNGEDPHGYFAARADRERFQAKRAELDYFERVGELVSVAAVRDEQFTVLRRLRDRLVAIADRVAPGVAAETDVLRAHRLLKDEIEKALNECSRAFALDAAAGAAERESAV